MPVIESKQLGGRVVQCKEVERNGIKVGIIEGYIATWDLDRGDWFYRDQFIKGAFSKSLSDLRIRKRQVRFKDHHGRTIGGFPIETVKEDDIGLFGIGEVNLEVQQGREAYLLAKQGVLTDFSVGFSVDRYEIDEKEEIRSIFEATVWEGSIVDEPMNPFANVTAVKSLAKRIAESENKDEDSILQMLSKFKNEVGDTIKISFDDFKQLTEREVEYLLKKTGVFSNSVCKIIASKSLKEIDDEPGEDVEDPEASPEAEVDVKEEDEETEDLAEILEQIHGLADLARQQNSSQ